MARLRRLVASSPEGRGFPHAQVRRTSIGGDADAQRSKRGRMLTLAINWNRLDVAKSILSNDATATNSTLVAQVWRMQRMQRLQRL